MLSPVRRTAAIATAYLGVLYVHGLAIASGERRDACAHGQPLFDVIHQWQAHGNPWVSWFALINPDNIIALLSVGVVAALVLHPQRQVVFRRFLAFHATLALVRASSIWVTTIPSPDLPCQGRVMTANPFVRAVSLSVDAVGLRHEWFGLGAGGTTCCDAIISGHAAILIVDAMLIGMVFALRPLRIGAWLLAAVGMLATTTVDRHYAVDVLVTFFIAIPMIAWYQRAAADGAGSLVRWIEQPEVFGPFTKIQKFKA